MPRRRFIGEADAAGAAGRCGSARVGAVETVLGEQGFERGGVDATYRRRTGGGDQGAWERGGEGGTVRAVLGESSDVGAFAEVRSRASRRRQGGYGELVELDRQQGIGAGEEEATEPCSLIEKS